MSINHNTTEDKILLLSNIQDFSDISNIIHTNHQKIISFDYETHMILENNNIPHSLSENFLNELDLTNIDNDSIKFSKWYDQKFLDDMIFFENINLGELTSLLFQHSLVLFLKKFTEIKYIFNLNQNATFLVSESLNRTMELFTHNVSIINNSIRKDILQDNINYELIDSPKKYLQLEKKNSFLNFVSYLKNFLKKFTNTTIISDHKTVLMVNFSTKRNKSFLLTLPKFKMNYIKFDRNIPSIWNLDSFFTIKKSGSIIENYSSLIDDTMKQQISENVYLIYEKMNMIFQDKRFFDFFILNELSFWSVIKNDLKKLFDNHLFLLITEISLIKNLFKKYSFSNILVFEESGIDEKIAIYFAKNSGVKVSCFQHGLLYPIRKNFDNLLGGFPVLSDNFFLWGSITHEYFKTIQTTSVSVIESGSPFYDDVKFIQNSKSDYILVAPAGLQNYSSTHKTISARLEYEKSLQQICKIATKLNKKLIIKIHPGLFLNEENIAKKINPKIEVVKSGDLLELIKSCSILITLGPTTATIESLILNKPTFCVPINAPNCNILFKNHEDLVVPLLQLEKTIELFFGNNDFSKKLLDLGKNFLDNYMINHGKASLFLLKFLEKN